MWFKINRWNRCQEAEIEEIELDLSKLKVEIQQFKSPFTGKEQKYYFFNYNGEDIYIEDKYLEESLIKLKENHLKRKIQDKKTEEKSKELDKEIEKVSNNYEKNEHEKRVSEILGN